MKKRKFTAALACFGAFVLWTWLVQFVHVQPIGPEGSGVGFAALNGWFHNLTGVHMALYTITDWLSLIPLGVAAGFGLLGLIQLIQGRLERSIVVLGIFYAAVLACFAFFEVMVINYRPILIEAVLEASYPSSTTMLCLCVMPTAVMQLRSRGCKRWVSFILTAFTIFMVTARAISGVHWITDIIGGVLLSAGLVKVYEVLA